MTDYKPNFYLMIAGLIGLVLAWGFNLNMTAGAFLIVMGMLGYRDPLWLDKWAEKLRGKAIDSF